MKKLLISVSLAAAAVLPSAAQAQAIPAAVIAVVDLDRVTSDCTACKTATAALRSQVQSYQSRENALAAPLQTEQKSIQAAIDALKGAEPDAALKARVAAFQTRQQNGAQELQRQQDQIKRNQQYVQKQIADKLGPIYSQVMQRRGANIMVEQGATLATATSLDVTTDVIGALNTAMPTIQTVAPAAPANTTQGR
jgi:Skp family chaperone for outer membrane proteins